MVEMALVLPVFAVLTLGGMQVGLVLQHYSGLFEATRAGARQLSVSRSSTTPYTDTIAQITASGTVLKTGSITTTVTIAGTPCSSDNSCLPLIGSARGLSAVVATTYPCNAAISLVPLPTNCTLRASLTERIE